MWLMAAAAALLLALVSRPSAPSLVMRAHGEGVDDRSYEPVAVSIAAEGVGPSYFSDTTRNYAVEFRDGLVSFLGPDGPGALDVSASTFPLAELRRVTTAEPNRTVWDFSIYYVPIAASTLPYDVYGVLAQYCARQLDGTCDPIGLLKGYSAEVAVRRWLFVATSVDLRCCDGSLAATLQECPVCGARDWLPVILGSVFAFVGAVAILIALILYCRKGKKRRPGRPGITDAGHRPPPANIGPAFDVHKQKQQPPQMQPPQQQSQQQQQWQQWQQQQQQQPQQQQWQQPQWVQPQSQLTTPYYMTQGGGGGGGGGGPARANPTAAAAAGPVVVKVSSADGKKRTARKDEPDAASSPIADVNSERDDRRKRNDKK